MRWTTIDKNGSIIDVTYVFGDFFNKRILNNDIINVMIKDISDIYNITIETLHISKDDHIVIKSLIYKGALHMLRINIDTLDIKILIPHKYSDNQMYDICGTLSLINYSKEALLNSIIKALHP